jgi:hypothetical protein
MLAAAVYVAAAFFQFAISGLYHTGNWAPSTHKLLMRCEQQQQTQYPARFSPGTCKDSVGGISSSIGITWQPACAWDVLNSLHIHI